MRGLRVIKSGNPVSEGIVSFKLPIGNYLELMLYLSGTNDTGVALTLAELGRIRVVRRGQDIINTDLAFLHAWSDLKGGYPLFASATAGAVTISVMVPFYLPGMPNCLDVRDPNELEVTIDWDDVNIDTKTTAITWVMYARLLEEAVERYTLKIYDQDVSAAAAATLIERLTGENIAALMLKGTNISDLEVRADGEAIWDGDDSILIAYTNWNNRVESAGTWGEVLLNQSGVLLESANREVEVQATFSAAGALSIRKFLVEPSATQKIISSVARAEQVASVRLARKPAEERERFQVAGAAPVLVQAPPTVPRSSATSRNPGAVVPRRFQG